MGDNVLRLARSGVAQVLRYPNEYQCTACGGTGVLLAGVRRALCPACIRDMLGLSVLGTPDHTGFLVLNLTEDPIDVGEFVSGPEYRNMCVAQPDRNRFDQVSNDREKFMEVSRDIPKGIVK